MKTFKSFIIEQQEMDERSTGGLLKVALSKLFNGGNYKRALSDMKKTGRRAAEIAKIYTGVDARELDRLAQMAEDTSDEKL